jgi:23S rRNA pseudouridine2605 synthase
MRLNKFLAENTELSRRKADNAIENGRVKINGTVATLGQAVNEVDAVSLDGNLVAVKQTKESVTLLLHKPIGYVCSKNGQGSKTVYDLLPEEYKQLNIAGRLDKDSSGLVLLTNDGTLLNEVTHPSSKKEKIYEVIIDKEIDSAHRKLLLNGTDIGDERPSKFKFLKKISGTTYEVVIEEGRNRQIRRTFEALDYKIIKLHREQIGKYKLEKLKPKEYIII